jgi:hypothetical protein
MARIEITGTGVVQKTSTIPVIVQHVWTDAELVPTETAFTTTGVDDITIRFVRGSGGRPVLNAFLLHTGKGPAMDPVPENTAENVCPDDSVCWTAGPFADEHRVYLGTSFDDVNNATTSSAEYRDTVDTECYSLSGLGLDLDTTYYWRIDEVNDPCVWKGDVWQFTTNDGAAFDPDPEDNQRSVELDYALSWQPGCLAAEHDVYFSTSESDVTNATSSSHAGVEYARVTMPTVSWDPPGDFDYATQYYWRVDAVNGSTIWTGDVWTFKSRWEVDDPTLLLWYKLDEEPPSWVAIDWSGHEYDGSVGQPNNLDPIGGRFDGCRIMEGAAIVVPPTAVSTISSAMTISAWLKDIDNDQSNILFDCTGGIDVRVRAFVPRENLGQQEVYWRAGLDPNDVLTWDVDGGDVTALEGWHHYVFMKDESAGTMTIYQDARLVAQKTEGITNNLATLLFNEPEIGGYVGGSNPMRARLDDFRMYDRTLSEAEIIVLFRGGDVGGAWFPTPPDRAVNVERDVTMTWRVGDFAGFHDIYFGTDSDDVNDATTASAGIYRNRVTVDVNYYQHPSILDLDTTYYWRIDEVNTVDPNMWKGKVWRFTVADFLVVDDMESYDALAAGNEIYDTWDDGFMNWTGSQLALEYGSNATVHGGTQAMKFIYNNSMGLRYSEIDANTTGPVPGNLEIGLDWTDGGVRALTLFFFGQPGNDTTEQMYVVLEDGSSHVGIGEYGDLGESMSDVEVADWHQWDIPLTAFSDAGVVLTDVAKVRIGFGDRDTPVAGGSGTVFFDDIRLYMPKCVPWLAKPAADFSGNCIVDLADVAILAEDWLRTDAMLATTAPSPGPVGWWPLDNDPWDYSGNFYDGNLEGSYSWVTGYIGSAINFGSEGGKVTVPDDGATPLLRPANQLSVCAWVNYSLAPGYSARVVVKGLNEGDSENFAVQVNGTSAGWFIRDVNEDLHGPGDGSVGTDEWTHLAGTYDGSVISFYINGRLETSDSLSVPLLQDSNSLAIGDAVDGDRAFVGKVDDVRVYNYGLSAENVAHIATNGSGYMPLLAETNLYNTESQGNRAVNFRDYALLMESWLEKVYWP